jgi:glutathione peroxidase
VKNKGVTFPVLGKLECDKGDDTHPLYHYLKASIPGWFGSGLKWNFSKFLCNSDGIPVQRYLPTTHPLSLETDIKKLLEGAREL